MAVPTLSNTPTSINPADSIANWVGEGDVDPDIKLEGTNAISGTMTTDGDIISYDAANFSSSLSTHVRAWVQFTALGNLDFMEMFLGSASTAFWEIFKGTGYAGSDPDTPLYRGGWFYCIIDLQSTPNSGTKPATVTQVGWRFQRTSAPRNVTNMWIDALYYGNGYTATGGTSGDPITFTTIADVDVISAYGIVQSIRDTNFLFGEVTIGNGATATYMKVANEAVIFADAPVSSTLYKIVATGSGCTFDSLNTLFKANGTQTFSFDMSGVNTLVCDGNVFIRANPLTFASGQSVTSCTFIDCGNIAGNGATFTGCTFDSTTAASAITITNFSQIVDCDFVSDGSSHAVEFTGTVPSSYTWDHTSSGYNSTAGNQTIYINPSSADSTNITISYPSSVTAPTVRSGTNYTGTVTIQVLQKTIDVNVKDEAGSPISGAQVWINDGTTTIFNGTTDASGNIPQQSYGGSSNSTLRVRKYGYQPFQTTLGTATGNVAQLVTALTDDQQQDAVPTPVSTWTISTGASTITMTSGTTLPHTSYSTMDTAKTLYQYVMNIFAGSSFMEFAVPFESVTATQYSFINGWTFGAKDNDYKFLYDGSFSSGTIQWSNIKSIGSLKAGTGLYVVQGLENADSALTSWWPDGNFNILIKTKDSTWIQSTDDTATAVDGGVWVFAREYGDLYDSFFADLFPEGQNVVALSTSTDLNNQTASGTVSGYTDITLTFGSLTRDIGDGNGLQPYAVEVNCNGRTLAQVYEYLKYITSFDFSATVNGDDGYEYRNADEANFSNVDNKQAPFGTFAGGRFFGAYGVFLTNMASADNNNYQLTDSNGVLRFPPSTVSFSLTGLKDGTEVRIYQTSDSSEVCGVEDITAGVGTTINNGSGTVNISGTTNNSTFSYTYTYSSDIGIYIAIVNLNYQNILLTGFTLTNSNQSIPVSQVIDRNYNNPP